jgi:hypothetical protein
LRAILEQCCAMSTEYISGQGGLFQVLTAAEMLDSDVAAARDDRRGAEGFVSPADARAFLELAKRGGENGEGAQGNARDPITRAYFRGLQGPKAEAAKREANAEADATDLAALLRQAEVIAPLSPAAGLLSAPEGAASAKRHLVAPLFERAMTDLRARDPACFAERVRELGYLVNVWLAGGAQEGRRPRPVEALEMVLRTCEAGLRAQLTPTRVTPEQALALLAAMPAETLFRRGFCGRR